MRSNASGHGDFSVKESVKDLKSTLVFFEDISLLSHAGTNSTDIGFCRCFLILKSRDSAVIGLLGCSSQLLTYRVVMQQFVT